MRLGLALPQYDYSVAGERPLRFETMVEYARRAEAAGIDSLWLADHVFLDLEKYGGSDERFDCFEPIVALGALARVVPRVRLGTLVLCEALRPASVTAKALATLDRISRGRIDVGIGAGWYEPDYEAIGMAMPPPAARLARLHDALEVLNGLLDGGPFTYPGPYHGVYDAENLPASVQVPRPRVFVGGKGDRLLRMAARYADGWNTCWTWTPPAYRERLDVLVRECEAIDREPGSVWRTLGLYALCGESQADLRSRFERLRAASPPGTLDVDLDTWRSGRLVGTVDEVREQAEEWSALGVETLILGPGAVPFHVGAIDDIELLAEALGGVGQR